MTRALFLTLCIGAVSTASAEEGLVPIRPEPLGCREGVHPPPGADHPYNNWKKRSANGTESGCCGPQDCRAVRWEPIKDAHGRIVGQAICVNKMWWKVPPTLIVGNAPRDGRAHACYWLNKVNGVVVPFTKPSLFCVGFPGNT